MTIRKTKTRRSVKTSKKSTKTKSTRKLEVFKATKSYAKTLSISKDKSFSNTVDYLVRHLQKNIRLGQKKQARIVYDCVVDLIVKPAPKVSAEVQNNLMAQIDKIGTQAGIAKMRYFDTAKHHCVSGVCKDHNSKTCRTFIENGQVRGCMNKP